MLVLPQTRDLYLKKGPCSRVLMPVESVSGHFPDCFWLECKKNKMEWDPVSSERRRIREGAFAQQQMQKIDQTKRCLSQEHPT